MVNLNNAFITTETSTQLTTTEGYFLESHRKKAGTPIFNFQCEIETTSQLFLMPDQLM